MSQNEYTENERNCIEKLQAQSLDIEKDVVVKRQVMEEAGKALKEAEEKLKATSETLHTCKIDRVQAEHVYLNGMKFSVNSMLDMD